MAKVDAGDTRNFALVGHAGDGKTSLGDAILHQSGATPTLGSVEEGTSHLNTLPEERERHTTISSAIYSFSHDGKHITLIDTPGDPNFQGDGRILLPAVDGALLLVSAVEGARVGTERMWQAAQQCQIPVIIFVNGLDRDRSDFATAVESLKKVSINPVVMAIPIGSSPDLSGVIDLLRMRAFTADGEGAIPDALSAEAESARQNLVESVAECDDALLEKYLEEGALSEEEVGQGLVAGVRSQKIVPVLCGTATRGIGVAPVLHAVTRLLPSPADRPARSGRAMADDSEVSLTADPAGPLAALVIKTSIDRYAGTLSVLRIFSGTLSPDSSILNATTGNRERVGKLLELHGDKHEDAGPAGPGAIVAVAKLKNVHTGNALTSEKGGARLPELTIPQGVLSYAIQAKSKGDEDKVYGSLGRLVQEDPTLHLGREASTGEFLLTGMGELHIRMTVQKLHRMFDVDVDLKTPKVPYRETITRKAEKVEGKLKKQTGGKGMFGVCYLSVEPRPRGEGFEFVNEVVGGAIPRNLIPAVEKGVIEACAAGPLAGQPVVDLRVRCIDGKHHSVDSNEMAFKLAGSFGLKAAVEKANPTLLEPVMNVEVVAPDQYVGDIMGDISSRRGRVQASESRGTGAVIKALVPMGEMLDYASVLTSITAGQGEVHMEFSHYDEAPAHVRERVVAEAKAAQAAES